MKARIRKFITAFIFVLTVFGSGFVFGLGNRPHLVQIAYQYGQQQGGQALIIQAICHGKKECEV